MKKIAFVLICFFGFINIYKAECTYKDVTELSGVASYVKSDYSYNNSTKRFDLILLNVPDQLYVQVNNKNYNSSNNEVKISGFKDGEEVSIDVLASSKSLCVDENLRTIKFTFPYVNNFYGSNECLGHENLDVCKYNFLPYQVDKVSFDRMISNDFVVSDDVIDEEEEKNIEVEDKMTFKEATLYYGEIIGIPVLLVLISGGLTFGVCSIIYRKIKHGL